MEMMVKNDLELRLELTKEVSKLIKFGLNNYHLKTITALANEIWSCENVSINYNFYLKDLKAYLKDYKKFYIVKKAE